MTNRQISIIAATTLVFAVAFTSCKDKDVTVIGVTVTPDRVTLDPGGTQQLTATVQPADATNQGVTWSSSNEARATVSATGLVTIPSSATPGEAIITVKTDDGGKTDICTVTVGSYLITASPLTPFATAFAGYAESPVAQTVTVTNNGTGSITLTQPAATNYDIGALSATTVAAGATVTFTVRPKADLPEGNYDETIAISGTGGASASVNASFSVSTAHVYTISATEEISFGSVIIPYTPPVAQTVTVTNTGTDDITLTQPVASSNFDIGNLSASTFGSGATITFTVRPIADLPIGIYDEIITISGTNDASASVSVTFEVAASSGPFGGGDGSEQNPYLIGTATHLETLATLVNEENFTPASPVKYFKLTANITLTGEWTPIGNVTFTTALSGNSFRGVFDGNGYTISGLTITSKNTDIGRHLGLFGMVGQATTVIKNLGIVVNNIDVAVELSAITDVTAVQTGSTAGLVGRIDNGVIRNCFVTGNPIKGSLRNTGGITGWAQNAKIYDCYSMIDLVGMGGNHTYVAGIAGQIGGANDPCVVNCYATGAITAIRLSGGIVGGSSAAGFVNGCIALNRSITYIGTGTTNNRVGRVVAGDETSIRENNAALESLTINIDPDAGAVIISEEPGNAGVNITLAEAKTQSSYANRGWAFGNNETNPWKMGANGLPILYWQTVAPELPDHLK